MPFRKGLVFPLSEGAAPRFVATIVHASVGRVNNSVTTTTFRLIDKGKCSKGDSNTHRFLY